jgi:tubulin polyglutamylase TTLL6/13
MCFELLGFDVIINEDLQPFILEINYTPSFSTDTPLDLNIKKSLIHDALVLMGTNKDFKEKTILARKECRDIRMMTGKKNKLTPEEKEDRRR